MIKRNIPLTFSLMFHDHKLDVLNVLGTLRNNVFVIKWEDDKNIHNMFLLAGMQSGRINKDTKGRSAHTSWPLTLTV